MLHELYEYSVCYWSLLSSLKCEACWQISTIFFLFTTAAWGRSAQENFHLQQEDIICMLRC
jgi:hypothetical protein